MISAKLATARCATVFRTHDRDADKGNLAGSIIDGRLGKDYGSAAIGLRPILKEATFSNTVTLHQGWIKAQSTLPSPRGNAGI